MSGEQMSPGAPSRPHCKIALLVVGHRDYPNDVGLRMAELAAAEVSARGVDLAWERKALLEPWDAAAAARGLVPMVDGVIIFLATWVEAPTAIAAIREVEHLPLAVWGFPMYGPERAESTGSFVAYAVVKAALERMGQRFVGLAGAVDDAHVLARAAAFCLAAGALQRLRRARVGLVGYASMGMYSGTFSHALLRRAIGPEVDQVDTYTLLRRAERYGQEECEAVLGALRSKARLAEGVAQGKLCKPARLYLALREIARERRWDAVNVKCQYELSQEYGSIACVPLSLLAEEGLVAGCEGDIPTTVAQLILHQLSGQPIYYGDLLDLHDGRALFSSCGMAPFSLADERGVELCEIGFPGFSGIVNTMALRPGPVTYAQLAERADGYALIYGTGLGLPSRPRQGRFPALAVQLHGEQERLLAALAGQHFALAYGDVSQELETLMYLLGMEAIRI